MTRYYSHQPTDTERIDDNCITKFVHSQDKLENKDIHAWLKILIDNYL